MTSKEIANKLNTEPYGELCLQTITMPKDANYQGDIFGGWVVSQMDLAGAVLAHRIANGRVATVAMKDVIFYAPILVGAVVRCYTEVEKIGNSSITTKVSVWTSKQESTDKQLAAMATIVYVAIDAHNKPRTIANIQ